MQHTETEDPNKPPNHTNKQMEADSGGDFATEKPESHSPEKHEKKKKKRKKTEIQLANAAEAVTGDDPTATDVVVEAPSSTKSGDKKSKKRNKENDVLAGGENSTAKISEEGLDMKPGPRKKRNKEKDGAVGGLGIGTAEIGGSNKEWDSDVTTTSKPRPKKKPNKGKDVAAVGTETEMSNVSKIGASDNPQNANPRMKKPSKPRKRVSFAGEVEVFDDKRKKFRRKEDDDALVQGKRFTPEEDAMIKEAVRKYIEGNQLGKEGLQMVLYNRKYPKLRGCWKEIGASLPWRPSTAVYCRAHILFERSEARKWQPHEYETLTRLHEQCGPDWKIIAAELGKHRIHVRDTWRRIGLANKNRGQETFARKDGSRWSGTLAGIGRSPSLNNWMCFPTVIARKCFNTGRMKDAPMQRHLTQVVHRPTKKHEHAPM